jgi:hypothetical protein
VPDFFLASLSVTSVLGGTFINDLSTTNLAGITPTGAAGHPAGESRDWRPVRAGRGGR